MPRLPAPRRSLPLLILAATTSLLAGCGTLHGSAQVGPDLKPRLGTSISVPLGK